MKEISWHAQHWLGARYRRLKARGKRGQKTVVAVARELAALLWELQNRCGHPIPEPMPMISNETS